MALIFQKGSFDLNTVDLSFAISHVLAAQHELVGADVEPITGPDDVRLLNLAIACHDLAKEALAIMSQVNVVRSTMKGIGNE